MRAKLFSNYESSSQLLKRLKMNYDIFDDDIQFVRDNNYDYAIVFNGITEAIMPGTKIITIIQEPSWSPLVSDYYFLMKSDYVLVHDKGLFEQRHNYQFDGLVIETPSYMFYHDKVHSDFFKNSYYQNKTKKISVIMSNADYGIGNYYARLKVLVDILNSDLDIDIYGRGLNLSDSRYKGEIYYKYQALIPYEYSIAIENSNEHNYISEKFFDCVLCNTIPIYNGAPNIAEVYDPRYFRQIDINSTTIIDDIKQIIKEPAPISTTNKEIYFNKFNLYKMLKHIIFEMT